MPRGIPTSLRITGCAAWQRTYIPRATDTTACRHASTETDHANCQQGENTHQHTKKQPLRPRDGCNLASTIRTRTKTSYQDLEKTIYIYLSISLSLSLDLSIYLSIYLYIYLHIYIYIYIYMYVYIIPQARQAPSPLAFWILVVIFSPFPPLYRRCDNR